MSGTRPSTGGVALALSLSVLAVRARADAPAPTEGGEAPPADVVRLDEQVVRLPRPDAAGPGSSTSVVEASRFAGEAKSVAELVATAPGVAVNDYGGLGRLATVSVRGASADGVRVLLDGLPLNSSAGGGFDLSSIPRQWISSIEVVRGAQGARYGAGALGGALNVVTRRADPGGWSGELSYGAFGTLSAAGEASAGGDRWAGVLALGYDETRGDFPYSFDERPNESSVPVERRVRSNNAGRSGGLLAKANVGVGAGRLDVLAQLSAGSHGLPGALNHTVDGDWEEHVRGAVVARHAQPLGGGFRLASELSARHERIDTRLVDVLHGTTHQRERSGASQVALAWAGAAHAGEVGLRAGGDSLDADGIGGTRERLHLAAFASEELEVGRLRIGPAVRWERLGGFQGFSGNLGASARIVGPLAVSASAGSTFRAPSFGELYLQQGSLAPNPDLRPEQSLTGDVGLELTGEPGFARVGAFAARYRDLVVYEPDSFRRLKPFNDGKAGASGLEVELVSAPRGPAGLSINGAYTLLATETLRGSDAELGKQLPHRARHRLFARLTAARGPFEAHGEAHYLSRQFMDRQNLVPIPEALTFHLGGAWIVSRRPAVSLHVDLRNLLNDRSLQDGFGNPLPGRMVMLTARISGRKEAAP